MKEIKDKTPVTEYETGAFFKSVSWLLVVVLILAGGFACYELYKINILPDTVFHSVIGCVVMAIIVCTFLQLLFTRNAWTKLLITVLSASVAFGGFYIGSVSQIANKALAKVTELDTSGTTSIEVLSLKSNKDIKAPADLNGRYIGVLADMQEDATENVLNELKDQGLRFHELPYHSIPALVNSLFSKETGAIILTQSSAKSFETAAKEENDQLVKIAQQEGRELSDKEKNPYEDFLKDTNVVMTDTVTYESVVKPDPVKNVLKDPFNVLVSDYDTSSYCLLSVNPSTQNILLVSIPGNYYVALPCESEEGCGDTENKDALSNTAMRGWQSTKESVAKAFDITVNYIGSISNDHAGSLVTLVQKLISSSPMKIYESVIHGEFVTDMPEDSIKELLKWQIGGRKKWNFITYDLTGTNSMELCYELGENSAVLVPDEPVKTAGIEKIKALLAGKSLSDINAIEVVAPEPEPEPEVEILYDIYGLPFYYDEFGDYHYI